VAVVQKAFADVRADEARAAGDKKIHGRKLNRSGRSVERAGEFAGYRGKLTYAAKQSED
jgi:hypothetical protein